MSKKKYRRGEHIRSLDELMNQETVYFNDQPVHMSWFGNWQIRWCAKYIGPHGMLYYAEPVSYLRQKKEEQ